MNRSGAVVQISVIAKSRIWMAANVLGAATMVAAMMSQTTTPGLSWTDTGSLSKLFGAPNWPLVLAVAYFLMIVVWARNSQRQVIDPFMAVIENLAALEKGDALDDRVLGGRPDEFGRVFAQFKYVVEFRKVLWKAQAEMRSLRAQVDSEREALDAARLEGDDKASRAIAALADGLVKISQGAFAYRVNVTFDDPAHESARQSFNLAAQRLERVFMALTTKIQAIRDLVESLDNGAQSVGRGRTQGAELLREIESVLNALGPIANRSLENAVQARAAVGEMSTSASKASDMIRQSKDAVVEVAETAMEIERIVSVVDGISLQTNLLALNAGVEAARAGESGKGFAVIASEIRALAQRSAAAAKQIKELTSASKAKTEEGVTLVDQASDAVSRLTGGSDHARTVAGEVATNVEAQASQLEKLGRAIAQACGLLRKDQASDAQMLNQTGGLLEQTSTLASQMRRYVKTGDTAPVNAGEQPEKLPPGKNRLAA